jgi:membrane associated rhomboid family serine protease
MQPIKPKESILPFLLPGIFMLGIMLAVHIASTWLQAEWYTFGIYPRTLHGLAGVFFSPFLHGSWQHLFSNAFPWLIMSFILFASFRRSATAMLLMLYVLSGFWTWCLGRPSYHIGASGLVYALASFLFFSGLRSPNQRAMAITAFVVIFYHQLLFGILPTDDGVSWEAHLAGLIAGFITRLAFSNELKIIFPQPKALTPPNAPYPYWLYNKPHTIDAQGNVLLPDELLTPANTDAESLIIDQPSQTIDTTPKEQQTSPPTYKYTLVPGPGKKANN